MDLKTFFALDEGTMNEMAGTAKDNPYNGFMYKKVMQKYGTHFTPGTALVWPRGTPYAQKEEDVQTWHQEAAAKGIYPSSANANTRTVISGLEWPFRVGAGSKGSSVNAARNMRALAAAVGFATQDQMADLEAEEQAKMGGAPSDATALGKPPKMSQVVRTAAPAAKAPAPVAAKEPVVRKSSGAGPADATGGNVPYAGEDDSAATQAELPPERDSTDEFTPYAGEDEE